MPPTPRPSLDWSIGEYEHTAAQLQPAAEVIVAEAAPAPGERVVDVGCGTGNGALLAAARGAQVTGVDPAARLLDVARERAAAAGVAATFLSGDAAHLPLPDGSADLVLSIFAVIFAPDPAAAAAELARVTAPGGRIVLSAWNPDGAVHRAVAASREAVARALGTPPAGPPFAWHDPAALRDLLAPLGFAVTATEHPITFRAASPRAFLENEGDRHPMAVAARGLLEPRGEAEALFDRMLAIYDAENEDPDAFAVTSRYVVATARRG
jgi:ubiquinone/menaquinone biosynthesis C-methylase UbiE